MGSDNVVSLASSEKPQKHEPIPEIVAELEEHLRKARSGELRAYAMGAIYSGGRVDMCVYPAQESVTSLIGVIGALQISFTRAWLDGKIVKES